MILNAKLVQTPKIINVGILMFNVIQPVHSWNTNQAKEEVDNSVVPIEEVTEHNPDSDCTCNVRHEEDCFEEAFTFNLLENNPCNDD